ncbi:MAG TPA: phage tail length tape measure family protein, partial [Azospirillaceae bacterium]|nr:phage tail length tape measure family protein [Azospirillaceae bacterium]
MAQKTVTIRLALEDADKVRRALEDLGDKGKAAIDKIDGASTKRLRADFDDLKRAMDPAERSAYELQTRLALLDRALKQGAVSQAEYNRVAAQARAQHEALAASFQKVETGTKLAAYQITNLGYQIQDVAVQLAGGQNPFLILIQQGPQAAGAVGGFGTLMRLMVSPTSLAVGGLLAFGGAAALVVSRAGAGNRELRTLQTTL